MLDLLRYSEKIHPYKTLESFFDSVRDGSVRSNENSIAQAAITFMERVPDEHSVKYSFEREELRRWCIQNQALCLPALRDAIEGTESARLEYERSRFTIIGTAPAYIQNELRREYVEMMSSLSPRRIVPATEESIVKRAFGIWLQGSSTGEFFDQIGMDIAATYSVAQKVLSELKRRTYADVVQFRPEPDGRNSWNSVLLPTAPNPVGRTILTVWEKGFDLLLKANILEDVLADIGLELPDGPKLKAVRGCSRPWDILVSPLVSNVQKLVSRHEAEDIDRQVFDAVLKRPDRLLMTQLKFEAELEELYAAFARKRALIAPAHEVESRKAHPTFKRNADTRLAKEEFFTALYDTNANSQSFRQFQDTHRKFFSLYKKGLISVDEAQDAIREHQSADALIRSLRSKDEATYETLITPKPSTFRSIVERLRRKARTAEEIETYTIIGRETAWFRKWYDSLTNVEKHLVTKRLNSAADGYLGMYGQFREDRRLFKFRFHIGDGKRLIFCFPDDKTILLLHGTIKKDQDRDLRMLARNLDSILASKWREGPLET